MTRKRGVKRRPTKRARPEPAKAPVMVRDAPLVWVNLTHLKDNETKKSIARTALEQGFSHVVVDDTARSEIERLGRFQLLHLGDDGKGAGRLVHASDGPIGRWITIRSRADEAEAAALAGKTDHVVISATDWKVIPLENLIADLQPTKTLLLAEVEDAQDAAVMLNTLEVGTDGVVLSPREESDVRDLARLLEAMNEERITLVPAEILAIEDAGRGERVCIDTCSLLRRGEGMLIGGSSKGLFLIHSESLESPYVNARPFRVNAGAVYAYVMGSGTRTHYLSEVKAGLALLAVDQDGNTRSVTVGRAKIETRPLYLVTARPKGGSETYTVVVQNAETIRFVTPGGGALSVAEARPGDAILLHLSDKARHFGRAIEEQITET